MLNFLILKTLLLAILFEGVLFAGNQNPEILGNFAV